MVVLQRRAGRRRAASPLPMRVPDASQQLIVPIVQRHVVARGGAVDLERRDLGLGAAAHDDHRRGDDPRRDPPPQIPQPSPASGDLHLHGRNRALPPAHQATPRAAGRTAGGHAPFAATGGAYGRTRAACTRSARRWASQ